MFRKPNPIAIALVLLTISGSFDSQVLTEPVTNRSGAVQSGESRRMRILTLRLRPGKDLRQELEAFAKDKKCGRASSFPESEVCAGRRSVWRISPGLPSSIRNSRSFRWWAPSDRMACTCTSRSLTRMAKPWVGFGRWVFDLHYSRNRYWRRGGSSIYKGAGQ